ncbi:MAG TPA: fructose 1,6-bisphosphatase, partial [Nitrososphaerales archaeon]|nr:fructose 1,6-bisphosphatase [Nitrososphaerales archaeon]
MKITLSAIKADIGGVGGHTKPSKELLKKVEEVVKR